MARDNLTVALKLLADPKGLDSGLRVGERSIHRFGDMAKREFHAIGAAWNSTMGRLGQIGLGVGLIAGLRDSAKLDKGLTQTKQTAGATRAEMARLRAELFAMGKQTGANIEDLKSGADALVASGQSGKAALEDMKGINVAMAVTGAEAKTLAGGLTVAGEAFGFDLEKPGLALQLLDKMTVAGRKGKAELENLSDIFARVGVNAASAGLGFEKTLAFVETLSLVESQPERLATLTDSFLRLFTNQKYSDKAAEASGISFFDKKGGRRDPVEVLKDFRSQFQKLKSDQARADWMGNVFGEMDLDTIKGVRTLLSGDALDKITGFEMEIKGGVGTLARDLPDALNNAVDQAGRLKNTLREAADDFSKPINEALGKAIQYGLDNKKLSGTDIIEGGAIAAVGSYAAGRLVKGGLGKAFGALGGTAAGVGVGLALQQSAGVTPVFVVNMPGSGLPSGIPGGDMPGKAKTASRLLPLLSESLFPALAAGGLTYGLVKATEGSDRPGTYLNNPKDAKGKGAYLREQEFRTKNYSWMQRFKEDSAFGHAIPLPGSAAAASGFKGSSHDVWEKMNPDYSKMHGAIERAIDASKVGDIGRQIESAVTKKDAYLREQEFRTKNYSWMQRFKEDSAFGHAIPLPRSAAAASGFKGSSHDVWEKMNPDYSKMHGAIERAIDASKVGDIGRQIESAVTKVGEKKATLILRILGTPAKVQSFDSSGFNLNIDTGLLPVGQ